MTATSQPAHGLRARVAWSSWQFPPIPQSRREYAALLAALGLQHACAPADGPTAHVVSLGSACFTARFMQEHGLRTHAGPLDWVFSGPCMAAHCLETDWAAFLDATQYERREGGRVGHRLYSAMAEHGVIFNHHDPLESAEDLAHFERSVCRLDAVLSSPDRKLFLLVSKEPAELAGLRALCGALARRTRRFELLCVLLRCHAESRGEPEEGGGWATLEAEEAWGEAEAAAEAAGGGGGEAEAERGGRGGGGGGGEGGVLRVYTLRCEGGHSGLAFGSSLDAARFSSLVLRQPRDALRGDLDDAGCRRRHFVLQRPAATLGDEPGERPACMRYDRVRDKS
jgi:hypothetical protein